MVQDYSDELRTEKLLWKLLDEPDTGSESLCTTQAYGYFISLAKPIVPSSHVRCGHLESR